MSESRRVELQTISVPKDEQKCKKRPLVPRFSLKLGESTATTCPEFSFTELAKKEKVESLPAGIDPFGDGDDCHDEVAALAKKFEEKYGPKGGGKKKRKLKCLEDEYFDLGDGYDENDPFIDNTEAYDEVVPSCLTTKHGGFYINRGTLDFRTLSDQEESDGDFTTPVARKRGRPRKIADSEEEEEGGAEVKKRKIKKKKGNEGVEGEKKKKKKLKVGPDGEKIKLRKGITLNKKKKMSPTVKELLKQQTASTATPGSLNGSAVDDSSPASPHLSPQGAVEKASSEDKVDPVASDPLVEADAKMNGVEMHLNQLPSDLPADLETAIVDIKKVAKDSKEGKCKFFSPHVNKLLLDIELASRQLSFGKRPLIYAHLADHLPCGKETLIKRAKKLRENQQDDQLKLPIQRLKEEIDKVMPALQEHHEQEVARARLEIKEKREGVDTQKEEGVNTESDEEDKNTGAGVPEGQSRKGNRDPRKKFQWTQEIRSLLCQIVKIKMHMFDTYKFRNQTAEEYLRTFLENEIKVLWPQGWIQTRMLFKETRSVHGSWTNTMKPKRPMLVSRSAASPTPTSTPVQSATASTVVTENPTSPAVPAKPPTSSLDTTTEVIEVSDIDEPAPVTKKDKVKAAPALVDTAEGTSKSGAGDSLKFSPNSVEAIAAAAAAAVAATVPPPKVEDHPTLGERRPHLMSEILKRPGGADLPGYGKSVASGSKTPPASLTPQGDASISPFMAEFSRYLSNNSNSVPAESQQQTAPLLPAHTSQLQSKIVSSSTGRPDMKKLSQWQVEEMLAEQARKVAHDVSGHSMPPAAHSSHKRAPSPVAAPMDTFSGAQARYQKMAALLMESDSRELPQKSKSEIVRDQILSKIQGEMDAASSRSSTGASRAAGEITGKRTSPVMTPGRSLGTPPVAGQPRQSPVGQSSGRQSSVHGASSAPKPPGNSSTPTTRLPPSSVSRTSPVSVSKQAGTMVSRQSPAAVSKQSPVTLSRQLPSSVAGQLPGSTPRQGVFTSSKAPGLASLRQPPPSRGASGLGQEGHSKSHITQHTSPSPPSHLSLPSGRGGAPVRPPTGAPVQKNAPSPSLSNPSNTSMPFQRSANTSTSQPLPSRLTTGQGPMLKIGGGQGQNVKTTAGRGHMNPVVRMSASLSLPQRSSPTNLSSSPRTVPGTPPSSMADVRKLPQTVQGAQKATGGTGSGGSSSMAWGQAVGQQGYQQMGGQVSPVVQSRGSPGQRSAADQAAPVPSGSQPSNPGSKSTSSTPHSKPPAHSGIPGGSTPRLQQPGSGAASKGTFSKPPAAHSGTVPVTPPHTSGFSPQAIVSSGLFNHRPVFRPLHSQSTGPLYKDPPRPPQGYKQ